jgi:hypothetical protein
MLDWLRETYDQTETETELRKRHKQILRIPVRSGVEISDHDSLRLEETFDTLQAQLTTHPRTFETSKWNCVCARKLIFLSREEAGKRETLT